MVRGLPPLLLLCLSGCHIISGVDGLELREEPQAVWRWSPLNGATADEVRAVGASGGLVYAAGISGGELLIDEATPLDEGGFVVELDGTGVSKRAYALPGARPVALSGSLLAGYFGGALAIPDGPTLMTEDGEKEAMFLVDLAAPEGALAIGGGFVSLNEKLAVARDDFGSVIVGGGMTGSLKPPGSGCPAIASESAVNLFLFKLDESGECVWSFQNPTTDLQAIESVAVDGSGRFVVGGEFTGDLQFSGGPVLSATGGIDFFIGRFEPDGTHIWSRSFGDSSQRLQSSARVATHLFGSTALIGLFDGEVDFGGGPISSGRGHDVVVVKFEPKGKHLWTRQFQVARDPCDATACDLDKLGVAFDTQGNLIVAGHFAGTIDLGGVTLTSENNSIDLFLAKLNADGELLWSGSFGDARDQCTPPLCRLDLAIDAGSNVLLGGYFENSVDFGRLTGTAVSAGERDGFVAKFAP